VSPDHYRKALYAKILPLLARSKAFPVIVRHCYLISEDTQSVQSAIRGGRRRFTKVTEQQQTKHVDLTGFVNTPV
jgi:hypothetical protein